MDSPVTWLSAVIFLPALGALVLALFFRKADGAMKAFTLAVTVAVFLLTVLIALNIGAAGFTVDQAEEELGGMQRLVSFPWIPSFNINYALGMDGISFPLILLTSFLTVLAMGASWNITKHVKAYCILFLLLETGVLGVFLSLDFFLFYVFWEVMLLPMYFLIGVWGGPRREYAAIKFFLYTLLGSVFMLIAILMLYFKSDVQQLSPAQLLASGELARYGAMPGADDAQVAEALDKLNKAIEDGYRSAHTFNILTLQQIGQTTELFSGELLWGKSLQWWAFLLLFVGFVIKVPSVPLHTWLPDAHVEAPTPISMLLAGILLKLGGYGIIRICYPICPEAGYDLAYFVCGIGVVSMVYGAFAALAQTDFKRMVAYSSVSHMGYVVLGMGVWSATAATDYATGSWQFGMNGAMFQMIAHGISSAGMFFMVGVVYDRVHHRNLNEFGGLFSRMPVYSGLAIVVFFAGLGLPGLCGFIGEVMVTFSVWNFSKALAVVTVSVVVLTAGYILWAIQRVYLGPEYKGPHGDHLTPITAREISIAAPLVAFAILLGVYPQVVFAPMQPSVDKLVNDLAAWTESNDAQSGDSEAIEVEEEIAVDGEPAGLERSAAETKAENRRAAVNTNRSIPAASLTANGR